MINLKSAAVRSGDDHLRAGERETAAVLRSRSPHKYQQNRPAVIALSAADRSAFSRQKIPRVLPVGAFLQHRQDGFIFRAPGQAVLQLPGVERRLTVFDLGGSNNAGQIYFRPLRDTGHFHKGMRPEQPHGEA